MKNLNKKEFTTIKVNKDISTELKMISIQNKISLQDLVEKILIEKIKILKSKKVIK